MSFDWRPYHHYYHHHHSVVGNLQIAPNVWSPQTQNKRHVLALLPPSYHQSDKRYPVIYMHDGQNLFDHVTSFAGDWQVDETMQKLSQEGLEAIIVGLNNTGEDRLKEYTPFVSQRLGGGHGKQYLDFLIDTVKPTIDRDFRTCPTPEHTGIVGSSLGGLISLYAFFARSDVFGLAGVMSPSLWFANRAIVDYVDNAPFPGGKIYLDAGTREYNDFDYKFPGHLRLVLDAAVRKGYQTVAWITYRENVSYVLPRDTDRAVSNYRAMNAELRSVVASGDYPPLQIWDLNEYTEFVAQSWFTTDGIHQLRRGSWGVADWISRKMAHISGRACPVPWGVGYPIETPCPDPNEVRPLRGYPQLDALYVF